MSHQTTKRNRSVNWDEEEKQLFRSVLKDYASIIEDKSLNTNTNKIKNKAWEEVHKKFNELNCRQRELSQLKIQWKGMKVNARKCYSSFKKELTKTGGGPRPPTPDQAIVEVKDLLNPAELLRDHNIYDSDGPITIQPPENQETLASDQMLMPKSQDFENVPETCAIPLSLETDKVGPTTQISIQESTPTEKTKDKVAILTPLSSNIGINKIRKVPKRKLLNENIPDIVSKTRKDQDYITEMLKCSKTLKEEEHIRRMKMAEEEHAIKMKIHEEKLKSAILEKEILELEISQKKKHYEI